MSPLDTPAALALVAITAPSALILLGCIAVWKMRERQARRYYQRRADQARHPATADSDIEDHRRDRDAYIKGAVAAMTSDAEYARLEAFANGEVSR